MPSSPSGSSSRKPKSRSSSGGGSREKKGQLTSNEKRIWQLIQRQNGQTISNEKLQNLLEDIEVKELLESINSLLSKSLLSAKQDHNGGLHYIAFSKSEASTMGQLDHDEGIIYSFIRVAGNEGIWTKQLKLRANLHQTIMQRALKSLESKQLIKAVKSVKFPTRKIYMLSSLTPSVELSGGPWYTDNELDTVFIDQLCTVLYQFIASKTWPGKRDESSDPSERPIYPASHINSLPTAITCLQFLKKAGITDTDLQVENVQSLLDVLVYDGKVEKIPHFRRGGNDDDDEWTSKGKRDGYSDESSEGSATGWIEVPCAHCPVFDFCSAGGPVNAEGCLYMRDWIKSSANMRAKELAQNEVNEDELMTNGVNGNHANGTIEYDEAYGEEEDETIHADASLNAADENEDDEYGGQEV
ncbi:uncharacterized protein FA14DRAFT_124209 [Meira miltonrushii]|uniref:DNA-directed RNA polymerase III subunit RPC6 n=1 Tax=Meira miltonrushii TaxID=1280837 RepID=A0A316V6Q9_9BASI|nr:uncharacterized protein FA14DRAFT_124209 [Meira miltonrushii]PWN33220.1 hypothetical protein FA14DRAFT_124209 [Meira miltonrushii]